MATGMVRASIAPTGREGSVDRVEGSRRSILMVVGAITTILLVLAVNPFFELPEGTVSDVVTYGFWISFIVLLILLFAERKQPGGEQVEIEGPAFTRFLFSNSRAGLFWLPIRLFLGLAWFDAGWHKLQNPAWVGPEAGTALRGYWENAVAVSDTGKGAITYDWYRNFIQFLLDSGAESWFSYLIVFGEIAVGVGLIIGMLTGFAAFFGALMNMSFLLAGSASTNPVMFTLAVGVMLAWKVAGWYGVDRWLLPRLGTPWRPGPVEVRDVSPAPTTAPPPPTA
jgi:thiosulfate dehydrogenase [quinone] large subunit